MGTKGCTGARLTCARTSREFWDHRECVLVGGMIPSVLITVGNSSMAESDRVAETGGVPCGPRRDPWYRRDRRCDTYKDIL